MNVILLGDERILNGLVPVAEGDFGSGRHAPGGPDVGIDLDDATAP
jgi:hypothetical protein